VVDGPRSFHEKRLTDYDDCSRCRGSHCCAEESACLADASCVSAAASLDRCLRDVANTLRAFEPSPGVSPPDAAAGQASCVARFGAAGALAQRRVACMQAQCARACGGLNDDLPLM